VCFALARLDKEWMVKRFVDRFKNGEFDLGFEEVAGAEWVWNRGVAGVANSGFKVRIPIDRI